ncbi:MAG: hypothetical protein D6695_03660 [Planctomycetota bacterium]|nr:MAG: hypothetical protein D6695_03660 [Planctomycetota bacterium]
MRGSLLSLESNSARLQDSDGRTIDLPTSSLLALLRIDAPPQTTLALPQVDQRTAEPPAIVTLTDGQRWTCVITATQNQDDLNVRVPTAGHLQLPLDVVRRIQFKPASPPDLSPSLDRVMLANADLVEGTVLSINTHVEIETDGSLTRIPLASVASIDLVNPPTVPAPIRVWMTQGDIYAAEHIFQDPKGNLRAAAVAPGLDSWTPMADVTVWDPSSGWAIEAIEFAPRRLIPWASLEIESFEPEGERRWTPPPDVPPTPVRLGLSDIQLPGPMLVTWRLPRQAARCSGTVTLGNHPGPWADCIVRVEQNGRILWQQRLNTHAPESSFVVELGSEPQVSLRVLAGDYGPVQDRVQLRLGWILLIDDQEHN